MTMRGFRTAGRRARFGTPPAWVVGLVLCIASAAVRPLAAAPLDREAMLGFLAQCLVTADDGRPVLTRPGDPGCRPEQRQRVGTPARWRKHDWGSPLEPWSVALGYQVSDSVLDREAGRDVSVETFDFGDGERRFGRFDKGKGDGGDYVALVGDRAYGVLTEDGGAGLQWFVGEGCRTGEPDGRLRSWLFFGADVRSGGWTETIARLGLGRSAGECPRGFGSALTRYRRAAMDVPFRVTDRTGRTTRLLSAVDTIVSEHFERATIETSDHLERFFFGRDFGKFRWEAWARPDRSPVPNAAHDAAAIAASGRCAPLPFSVPPDDGFVMVDCRTWTNLVWQARPWAVSEFGWPDVKPFGDER